MDDSYLRLAGISREKGTNTYLDLDFNYGMHFYRLIKERLINLEITHSDYRQ